MGNVLFWMKRLEARMSRNVYLLSLVFKVWSFSLDVTLISHGLRVCKLESF
jgi:hypothetical protein